MPDPATGDPGSTEHGSTEHGSTEHVTPEPEDHSHDLAPATPGDPTPADLTPPDATPAPDYDEHGTPSLDHVRDRIEARYATSLGAGELAADTDRARDQAEQEADRDRKAADRLAEIRRSLG